jgi:hypothetical protein
MNTASNVRENAGFNRDNAARRLRITPDYLARCERTGDFPYVLARRAAHLYGADLAAFLPTPTERRAKPSAHRSLKSKTSVPPAKRDGERS